MVNAFYCHSRLLLFSSLRLLREGLWGDGSWEKPRARGQGGE